MAYGQRREFSALARCLHQDFQNRHDVIRNEVRKNHLFFSTKPLNGSKKNFCGSHARGKPHDDSDVNIIGAQLDLNTTKLGTSTKQRDLMSLHVDLR